MNADNLTAVSPLDGRYANKCTELKDVFSEYGLILRRVLVECAWLEALCDDRRIRECKPLTAKERKALRAIAADFSVADAARVKEIEKTTNHDVKAVEYFLKEKVKGSSLESRSEFIHFGCTSEDINNMSHALMLRDGKAVLRGAMDELTDALAKMARETATVPMLAHTHGQPASPTTVGKELAVVVARLRRQAAEIDRLVMPAKMNGAVGNFNAHLAAYPDVDWEKLSGRVIASLGLRQNRLTTQIESHDGIAELFDAIARWNSVLLDFDRDVWMYVSMGYFKQRTVKGEIGSSTMPHKVNPIDFENSEGNLGLANAVLGFMARKLALSRLQRDLTDSTTLRNMGVGFGYALVAIRSTRKGLGKLELNAERLAADLDSNWEVLAEPIQTVMRKVGMDRPYERLKELTRGRRVTAEVMRDFVKGLPLPKADRARLLKLTPAAYTGLAAKLARLVSLALAVAVPALAGAATNTEAQIAALLKPGFLPPAAAESSLTAIFDEVAAADRAADRRWRAITSAAEYDAYRRDLQAKMIKAIGGFPRKTPLNAKTLQTVRRDGYAVDKVLFESMPGVYVTGHFYRPDGAGPFPCVVVACGHSTDGKNCAGYQRAAVQLVNQGLAAFIYDPYEQGDRLQIPSYGPCKGHNAIGVRAMLLGGSMAQLRIWDGVRSIDYVLSRPDVKKDGVGFQGNSGGGTMTSLMMAVDERILTAAPSCYLTSLRTLAVADGPQDAEQNIFGGLSFGLNHAGLILMRDIPILVVCRKNDFFPFYGTCETFDLVNDLAERLGRKGQYRLFPEPGPHGWIESTREASARWMRQRLANGPDVPSPSELNLLDIGFNIERDATCDTGLARLTPAVPPTGQVRDLPGFRTVYDVLRDRLAAFEKNRRPLTALDRATFARSYAKVRPAVEAPVCAKTVATVKTNGLEVVRLALVYANGLVLPAVRLTPEGAAGTPALLVREGGRAASAARAAKLLDEGRPVEVLDYTAAGEIAKLNHRFYGSRNPGEETAQLLYWLGDSLVGRRATDILVAAENFAKATGRRPQLYATGDAVVPAAHAFAADPTAFAGVEIAEAPRTWSEIVRGAEPCDFANCVNGALADYDWPNLLP